MIFIVGLEIHNLFEVLFGNGNEVFDISDIPEQGKVINVLIDCGEFWWEAMNENVGDKMVKMSSNTRRCWLCQYCGAYLRGYIYCKSKHSLLLRNL